MSRLLLEHLQRERTHALETATASIVTGADRDAAIAAGGYEALADLLSKLYPPPRPTPAAEPTFVDPAER